MHVDVAFSGLRGPTTAAHIHCCLPSPLASGVNAMVATTTPTFTGFPLGVTSGTYSHDFDLTLASSYNPAFITSAFNASGTIAGAEAALEAGIGNGETYLNIHTALPLGFPGGEIRGFLVAPDPVRSCSWVPASPVWAASHGDGTAVSSPLSRQAVSPTGVEFPSALVVS
jgi:hypothetical protein